MLITIRNSKHYNMWTDNNDKTTRRQWQFACFRIRRSCLNLSSKYDLSKKRLSGRGFGLLEERMPVNWVWGVWVWDDSSRSVVSCCQLRMQRPCLNCRLNSYKGDHTVCKKEKKKKTEKILFWNDGRTFRAGTEKYSEKVLS